MTHEEPESLLDYMLREGEILNIAPPKPVSDPWNPESPTYGVLAHVFAPQGNARVCNEPYVVNGYEMGYCKRIVKRWGKRAGTHRGDHTITWRTS